MNFNMLLLFSLSLPPFLPRLHVQCYRVSYDNRVSDHMHLNTIVMTCVVQFVAYPSYEVTKDRILIGPVVWSQPHRKKTRIITLESLRD